MHAKQVLAFRLRSGLRPLAPPALQNLFRVASVLHQHETKRKSPHHPHDGFNESADIPAIPEPVKSAVSQSLSVSHTQEILIRPEYIQSSSQPAKKQTQWFLNGRIPFTSIASGMSLLTRIRPEGDTSTLVVVSSQKDGLAEIGIIKVPEGAAMVVQPRSLVAVVKSQNSPVNVTRHWRLGSLHAWITLQLRYLVFHGPCELVLTGCRGVRAEKPNPGMPRMINQAATIGFSANLDYRNTRCETFMSYFLGKEDLFNDLFAGDQGIFVYEEMPANTSKAGVAGRGLEGVLDAGLKVFGI